MINNEKLLYTFYTAFQNKDYHTMQQCYSDTMYFNDEVFNHLDARHTRAMWEMLIRGGKDLEIQYTNIEVDAIVGSVEWTARYTFPPTGRRVVNHITSHFVFDEGLIVHQSDHFDFYKWARQALGFQGWLLGWTPFLKERVQKKAQKSLSEFLKVSRSN
jgi:limonene-1,2-epoxide hydrolase